MRKKARSTMAWSRVRSGLKRTRTASVKKTGKAGEWAWRTTWKSTAAARYAAPTAPVRRR